mmetsp:Transcript_4600/g.11833  ORF Transcript_4600/g.11833 Transcript_4600/m.11833 type:complete len:95 (-) Transcript_4600:51-335(-)
MIVLTKMGRQFEGINTSRRNYNPQFSSLEDHGSSLFSFVYSHGSHLNLEVQERDFQRYNYIPFQFIFKSCKNRRLSNHGATKSILRRLIIHSPL